MATDAALTRTQKNAVLKAIQSEGFDGTEFSWKEEVYEQLDIARFSDYLCSSLEHLQTGYYFVFGYHANFYSPGSHDKVESEAHSHNAGVKISQLHFWLQRVRRECDAPDLWAMVGKEKAFIEAASTVSDNSVFTSEEQTLIIAQLDDLKTHLLQQQTLQAEQIRIVENSFEYLKQASTRLGRKDFVLIMLGTLAGQASAIGLDQAKAHHFLALIQSLFQWIVSGAQGLLGN